MGVFITRCCKAEYEKRLVGPEYNPFERELVVSKEYGFFCAKCGKRLESSDLVEVPIVGVR